MHNQQQHWRFETRQHKLTSSAVQAPSPEMGMANPVDKAVGSSDDQEPKARTIGNLNHLQTSGIVGKYGPLTMLTNNPVGLLLTRTISARLLSALGCAVAARLVTRRVQESQVLARD